MILRVGPDEREAFAAAARRFADGDAGVAGFARSPGALGFVAVEASEVEGWCYGYLMARPDGTSMAYLHNLEVASEHRGRGLGRELLRSFMTAAREAGADKLFLTTGAANIVARRLYESMGGGLATQGPTVSYWFSM